MTWEAKATNGELYGPAMAVTTQEEADAYLQALIDWSTEHYQLSPAKGRELHLKNLGYWAGYYDDETWARVMRLFDTQHPIFGKERPSFGQAFNAGLAAGHKARAS